MLPIRQNLKRNLLIRMKMMKLLVRYSYARLPSKKIKVKNRVSGDTCRSLLNDVKSLSFLIENDHEKSELKNLKEEIVH